MSHKTSGLHRNVGCGETGHVSIWVEVWKITNRSIRKDSLICITWNYATRFIYIKLQMAVIFTWSNHEVPRWFNSHTCRTPEWVHFQQLSTCARLGDSSFHCQNIFFRRGHRFSQQVENCLKESTNGFAQKNMFMILLRGNLGIKGSGERFQLMHKHTPQLLRDMLSLNCLEMVLKDLFWKRNWCWV